jgi:hypothetical protein
MLWVTNRYPYLVCRLDRAGHIVRAGNSAKVGGAGEAAADFERVAALALQSNEQAIRRAIQKESSI